MGRENQASQTSSQIFSVFLYRSALNHSEISKLTSFTGRTGSSDDAGDAEGSRCLGGESSWQKYASRLDRVRR